ncbi:MAG: hypothetical protein A2046_00675 [Bacteroidetes bacterium GWA2_30_7]|nr:MAG: hypothetical protein A2046_00675 [Bacteroidetes bacterium GWA2_30_7]
MLAVIGTYQNGFVKFDRDLTFKNPVKVIITFLEEIEINSEQNLNLSDFSFAKSKKLLKDFKGSFSDTVVEERRKA